MNEAEWKAFEDKARGGSGHLSPMAVSSRSHMDSEMRVVCRRLVAEVVGPDVKEAAE